MKIWHLLNKRVPPVYVDHFIASGITMILLAIRLAEQSKQGDAFKALYITGMFAAKYRTGNQFLCRISGNRKKGLHVPAHRSWGHC